VPIISVLHGGVIGAGIELALSTHIRVAEEDSYFSLPEVIRGIYVGGGGSVRIPKVIGTSRMMDMMLTGRVYKANEGLAMGLCHYVVEKGKGLEKAMELAKKIAGNNPSSNFAIIQALPRSAEGNREQGFLLETLMANYVGSESNSRKSLGEFLEGRATKITAKI